MHFHWGRGIRKNTDLTGIRDVRLIDDIGTVIGIVPVEQALRLAEERELDLVEVDPRASPPVCKIMDLSKILMQLFRKELSKDLATLDEPASSEQSLDLIRRAVAELRAAPALSSDQRRELTREIRAVGSTAGIDDAAIVQLLVDAGWM